MISRGIVLASKEEDTKVLVRLPIIHGIDGVGLSVPNEMITTWASVLCTPGTKVTYSKDDIVIVAYEDYSSDKPLVLGHLASPIGKYVCAKLNDDSYSLNDSYNTRQRVEVFPSIVAQDVVIDGKLSVNTLEASSQDGININSVINVTQGKTTTTIDLVNMQERIADLESTVTRLNGLLANINPVVPTPPATTE